MKKYLELFRVTVDQYFVYRLNFVLWRFRTVLNLILVYFLWTAIYLQNGQVFGYSKTEMLTYILLISVLSDLVFSSRIHDLSGEILNGDVIHKILKPMGFFKYIITREAADKFLNISFAVVEVTLLIIILKPTVITPPDIQSILLMILHLLIGLCLAFFISFCFSMIAFWSAEVWAPRFIYFMLLFSLAGNFFPLNILPPAFYNALLYTPFPYFIFIPAQLYIRGMGDYQFWQLGVAVFWVFIFYLVATKLWNKGLKEYSFYGR